LKNENLQILGELTKKNKRLEIYRNNKSNDHILSKNKVYNNSEKDFKILEEEFKRKISVLEKENLNYKKKFEDLLKKKVTEKDATKGEY
jgi:hypothetical protein